MELYAADDIPLDEFPHLDAAVEAMVAEIKGDTTEWRESRDIRAIDRMRKRKV